ncbi:MAG: helix-turn-helix domain-containing protein [Candidatus Aureabacteria bacterium]|nr:helix-turn-helix domain-containing protein [Candidatus Auribacterota bacterium]
MDKLFNVKDICATMSVPRVSVIRWIKSGKLKGFKLSGGRKWRVWERDLVRFIKEGRP